MIPGSTPALDTGLRVIRRRLRSSSYLRKWVVLGAIIGIVGGLGAILFYQTLELATHLFLGVLAGYAPPTPTGEGGSPLVFPIDAARPWAIPLVVALGGLIAGFIVFRWAPEAEGHGTDAAIAAFHHNPRGIRARIPFIKLIASAITIGSGGSGGREGPTAQISAGFGSFLARFLDLDARDARIAVSVGMAAGIGAIFRAPLGGAVLGAELHYRDDVESDALVPSFIATIVAYSIFGAVEGFQPIFGAQGGYAFSNPAQLGWYALIGIASGLVGILYIRSFYGFTDRFRAWRIPRALKPALAGLVVGCIGLAIPGVLGTGYGLVQAGLGRDSLLALPLWIVIVLPFAKILATSLSIGSGGSGGIFGPGMAIGGLLGAGIWRLVEPIGPAVPADPAPFVIVAMMALFGSIAHAPLAVMLMVAEMTGNLSMLAPAMVAVGFAAFIVGGRSIYKSQLASRADSPAHRFRFALPLLSAVPAGQATRQARAIVPLAATVGEAIRLIEVAGVPGAPVVRKDGSIVGLVDLAAIEGLPPEDPIEDHLTAREPIIAADDALDEALGALADHHRDWAPVAADGRLDGIISVRDAITAYRAALNGNVRQVRGLRAGGLLLEIEVGADALIASRLVSDIPWPRDTVLVAVERGESVLVPRGDMRVQPGDRLSIFADPSARAELDRLIAATRPVESEAASPATG